MKKIINVLSIILIIAVMTACDTAGGIDSFSNGTNGALASWVTPPQGSLIISDPTTGLDFEVEFVDEDGGNTVDSWTLTVTDAVTVGTVFTQTSFSENANGNQGFSETITLTDIASALGATVDSFEEGDEFIFSSTLTRNGTVYPVGSASQFLNAVADFDASIAEETTSLTSKRTKSSYLNSTSIDTIFLEFENDFTTELATNPTLSAISSGGNAYTIGTIQKMLIEDEDDLMYLYWATITPPATIAVQDTVSIKIADAEIVSNFPMINDTIKNAYIVDYTAPTVLDDLSSLKRGSGLDTLGYNFNYIFSEDVGSVKLTVDFVGVDDNEDGDIDEDGDEVEVEIDVTANEDLLDYTFMWTGASDGEVHLVLEVRDLAGNLLSLPIMLTP